MKTIYKIAKTELQVLFYSPVAWLILVVFAFQSGILYTDSVSSLVKMQALKWPFSGATLGTFTGRRGLFTLVQQYLFLYVPLLTMGIMSREIGSGSIKLLYSSPLTNRQIILGKYLSLMIYGLALIGIMGVFGLHAMFAINSVDYGSILCGLLGLYLLMCTYAAIGLFMSSLTSYAVVAAIGTLGTFAILGYVKGMGQDIEFVREIMYWLAISGRSDTFISGLLTSEDVMYFLIVIGLFLALSILKLQTGRQKSPWFVNLGKYMAVIAVTVLLGYFTSRPQFKLYYDATETKVNTLTKNSQDVVDKLKGGLTIDTYVNMLESNYTLALPAYYKQDVERFTQYIRFKPDIKLKHHYYYHRADNPFLEKQYPKLTDKQRIDTLSRVYNWDFKISPYDELKNEVDLTNEKFRFVRQLQRESGEKTFLRVYNDMMRVPSETEMTAAFKRLVMKLPIVGFLTGQEERDSNSEQDRGYKTFAQEKTYRYSLINQGFDFKNVTLDQEIPAEIRILVIAEMKKNLTPEQHLHLNNYIARGGNLVIAGEPGRQPFMNPLTVPLGVEFLPGMLVKPSEKVQADLMVLRPTKEAIAFSYYFEGMEKDKTAITMPTTAALKYSTDKGFNVIPLFTSDSTQSWNELQTKNVIDDSVTYNPASGELKQPYPTVLALSRKINNKEQRILITGDADWLSNGELAMSRNTVRAANFSLINGAFYWLSDEEAPIDVRRATPSDASISTTEKGWPLTRTLLKWVFPFMLIAAGLIIWIRRRGR